MNATLRRPTEPIVGIGLFTGQDTACTIYPADPGSGIAFRFGSSGPIVPATIAHLATAPVYSAVAKIEPRNSNLAIPSDDERWPAVLTVEHVLSAIVGLGVTDALVELSSEPPCEVPIGNGSADVFAQAILDVGVVMEGVLDGDVDDSGVLQIAEPIIIERDGSRLEAHPLADDEEPTITYRLDYGPRAPIKPSEVTWRVDDRDGYARNIAPARTFSMRAEAEQMQALGLFQRFTPTDLPVVDDDGSLIDNDWRFDDEPARHKLLDLIGDLSLTGVPVNSAYFRCRIVAERTGHARTHDLVRALVQHLPSE
ncbi:MAG: UDP-3-O-acyl-N-acetylglucosamine deacetylase [Planctomycetota bacterium]